MEVMCLRRILGGHEQSTEQRQTMGHVMGLQTHGVHRVNYRKIYSYDLRHTETYGVISYDARISASYSNAGFRSSNGVNVVCMKHIHTV